MAGMYRARRRTAWRHDDRVVDLMELVELTLMIRDRSDRRVDRYSERKGAIDACARSLATACFLQLKCQPAQTNTCPR
jgi:hypothetical protein